MDAVVTRYCPRCGIDKSLSSFSKDRQKKDGLATYCRECNKARHKTAYIADRENRLDAAKRNHLVNREHNLARMRARYVANTAAYKAEAKKWAQNNPDKVREKWLRQYRQNPEAARERVRKRLKERPEWFRERAAFKKSWLLQATPVWASRDAMRAIYREAIELSKQTGVPHEVDHIVPLISDVVCGLHCEANLQILTAEANRHKANRFDP